MSRDSTSHPEKAASRAIGRDRATEPVCCRLVDVAREQETAGESTRIDAMCLCDGLGEDAGEPVRLAPAIRDVLSPCPGEAEPSRLGLELRDQPRLAHPRVAA